MSYIYVRFVILDIYIRDYTYYIRGARVLPTRIACNSFVSAEVRRCHNEDG